MITLDSEFLATWHPRYERTENDEPVYRELISAFQKHSPHFIDLPEGLLRELIRWKSARIHTRVDYDALTTAVRSSAAAPRGDRMAMLDVVAFVGPPVASTILHFMYPNTFPIFDVRTAEVLCEAELTSSDRTTAENYPAFVKAIFEIKGRAPDYSLRQIDRALFAFHKQEFQPIKPKPTPSRRTLTSNVSTRGARSMTNHDMIAAAVSSARGQQLSNQEIWRLVHSQFPNFNQGSLLPNDHAEGNKGACPCANSPNRIFDRLGSGRYLVR